MTGTEFDPGIMFGALYAGPEPDIRFTVFGLPAGKGSKRAFAIRRGPKGAQEFTGKTAMVDDNRPALRDWTRAVGDVIQNLAAEGCPRIEGPVVMSVTFWMPRPKSHPKGRRTWPSAKPDLDKLVRALDPMSGILIEDDARIVHIEASKDFAVYSDDDRPRAVVSLWSVETWEAWIR